MAAVAKLKRGEHRIRVSYFQGPRYEVSLIVGVMPPGDRKFGVFNTEDYLSPEALAEWKKFRPDDPRFTSGVKPRRSGSWQRISFWARACNRTKARTRTRMKSRAAFPDRNFGVWQTRFGYRGMVGQTILHYQILQKLGAGGMGEIYKAQDTKLNRAVAIKVLSGTSSSDPDSRRRFIQEAQAASSLNHPNIITIHDIVSQGEDQIMVMEFVNGKTLGELIPPRGLNTSSALHYAVQIADGLRGAFGGHRPSRSETGQHHGYPAGAGQDSGLRTG